MEYFDSEINVAGRNSLTILDRNFTGLVSITKLNQLYFIAVHIILRQTFLIMYSNYQVCNEIISIFNTIQWKLSPQWVCKNEIKMLINYVKFYVKWKYGSAIKWDWGIFDNSRLSIGSLSSYLLIWKILLLNLKLSDKKNWRQKVP